MSSKKQFQGSLETMPLSNILQWLADSKKTGTLIVTIGAEDKRIVLRNGVIVSASSNLEKERFGNIIIKMGYVTQKQVESLLKEGKETGKLLGKLCAEKGLVPEEKVKSILLEQSVAIVESLLHREEGQFVFLDETLDESEQIPLSIAMQELFFGSAGKRKEWQRIYEFLGSLESVPKATGIQTEKLHSLSEFQQKLLSRCDGKRRILDILAEIDEKDFVICQALADLVEKKWIHIDGPSEKMQREYQDRMWQVHVALEQKRFLRANLLLDDIAAMFPERFDDVRPLQDKAMRFLREDMDSILADEAVVLYRKPGFDQSNVLARTFGPQEWFIYSRVVDNIKLRDLMHMTGLPKEAARRAIYALIDAGAVDFEGRAKENEDVNSIPIFPKTSEFRRKSSRAQKEKKPRDGVFRDELINTALLRQDELDKTYRKYLKMNHYQLLGVTENSSQEDIRNAFVKLSRQYHPDMYDREKLDPEIEDRLEELFSMVNHAYRIVSNTRSRERYDKNLWVDGRIQSLSTNDLENRISHLDKIVLKPQKQKTTGNDAPVRAPVQEKVDVSKKPLRGKQKVEKKEKGSDTDPSRASGLEITDEKSQLGEAIDLFKDNKFRDAIEKLENLLKRNPRKADAYYYLSRCQQRLGGAHMNDALDNIKRALILDKENVSYFCQIGRVFIGLKMFDEAERFLKTALAWESDDREAKYLMEKLKEAKQSGFFSKFKKKKI
jgi:curved DNA-binding protein CbpA